MTAILSSVPVVDLRDASTEGASRVAFVDTLGRGLTTFGFVSVIGHGVDPDLLSRANRVAAELFALDEKVKRLYESPEDGRQRGYTPMQVERARDQSVADLKEFWHVGREQPPSKDSVVPRNRLPLDHPEFGRTMLELYSALEAFALSLLDGVGEYLGQPPSYFRDLTDQGNSVLRVIHYPDLGEVPVGAVRAAAHEDINLMTVLPASTRPGLELLTRDGRWMAVETPPGVMVCDTGDMMAHLTGGQLPATTHRVVNPEGGGDGGRFSMPFFLHPAPDVMLRPLRGSAPTVRAHDFLMTRLRENGVLA